MSPTIYVITYYDFNHGILRPPPIVPLDNRFIQSDKNYVYYLIDQHIPEPLCEKKTILEYDLDPVLHRAGGKFLGEWSFLLAEEKHSFCEYPFFMISSRFYEKNIWLDTDLDAKWDSLFGYLKEYGWGYLPSYDRPLRWIDLSWENKIRSQSGKYRFSPFKEETYQLIHEVFGVRIPQDYRFTADLFCNYIGFRSREELLSYVQFYRPLIDHFFDSSFSLKQDLSRYVRHTGSFRNEKSFTFLLELISHLFFFQNQHPFFALHYDGYYEVNEMRRQMRKLVSFEVPFLTRCERFLKWQKRKLLTEGFFSS